MEENPLAGVLGDFHSDYQNFMYVLAFLPFDFRVQVSKLLFLTNRLQKVEKYPVEIQWDKSRR